MTVKYDFNPDKEHPLFIIRHGLYDAIVQHKYLLTGKMMDFGCGSKPYQSLFTHVSEYIGVDYESASQSHSDEDIDVYYDGSKIPFAENTFDSILSTEVFEHVFNLDVVLNELHRVLKPSGKMLFTCPFVWNLHEIPIDYARYTPFALTYLLEKNGFKIITIDKIGTFSETLTQMELLLGPNRLFKNKVTLYLGLSGIINRLFICYKNIWGSFKSKYLYHNRYDLYLCNIVLVEKT